MDWTRLEKVAKAAAETPIIQRFAEGARAREFSVSAGEMLFDYSKTAMDDEGRALLLEMYEAAGVPARREEMFAGAKINETDGRAVLHTALRNLDGDPVIVDGKDAMSVTHRQKL